MDWQRRLRNWKDIQELPARSVIFREGEPADVLFVILEGDVKMTLRGRKLGQEGQGSIIGVTALLDGAPRHATATAWTEVRLARLDRPQVTRLMEEDSAFAKVLIAALAQRLRDVDAFITSHLADAG